MAANRAARSSSKDLKAGTTAPPTSLGSRRSHAEKATAPVFSGFVKTLNLESLFKDDKDLSLKLLGTIVLGSGFGIQFFKNMTTLSYPVQDELTTPGEFWLTARYTNGPKDLAFVALWIVFFTYIRLLLMKSYFTPMAERMGIRGAAKLERFAEQLYILVYYFISWTSGMALMYNSPYWMNTDHYWIGYPHNKMSGAFKAYYLIQLGYWIQQIYVVNTDLKRKDYWAMLVHHFITCALIGFSYTFFLGRVGNAILVVMDVADVFLAVPKVLKYLGYTAICDYLFGLFVVSWAITRHYLFPIIIMSLYNRPTELLDMKWDPANDKYFTNNIRKGFLGLLYGLEAVLCFWFLMIFKVIYKMFNGAPADDNRSHDEDSEEEVQSLDSDQTRGQATGTQSKLMATSAKKRLNGKKA